MKDNLTLLSVAVAVVLAMALYAIARSVKKPVYRKRGQLLLLNEQKLLTALLQALPPDMLLTVKIRLLDIVSCSDARNGRNLDRDLADYAVDFVLIDRNTSDIRLCIEMDMESQNAAERIARNTAISRALRRAGVAHLRLPLVRYYDPVRLRQIIRETVGAAPVSAQPHALAASRSAVLVPARA